MYITLLTIVRVLAALIIVAGVVFTLWPEAMKRVVAFVIKGSRLYAVAAIRIAAGIVLLLAADGIAKWWILSVLGVMILLAGISQLILPPERQRSFANWMMNRSEIVRRLIAIIAILIGGLMLTGTFLK